MIVVAGEPGTWLGFRAPEFLELASPVPLAPGTPTAIEVDGMKLEGKSQGSKRLEDGRFRTWFRLVSLQRQHRLRLERREAEAPTKELLD